MYIFIFPAASVGRTSVILQKKILAISTSTCTPAWCAEPPFWSDVFLLPRTCNLIRSLLNDLAQELVWRGLDLQTFLLRQDGSLTLQQSRIFCCRSDFDEWGCSLVCKMSWFVRLWLLSLGIPPEHGEACVDHRRIVIELEQNIREETEAILMDVSRRVMENWFSWVQDFTLENGRNNGDFVTKKPHNL